MVAMFDSLDPAIIGIHAILASSVPSYVDDNNA